MLNTHQNAPIFVRLEDEIHADTETVWQFISDIGNWPDWNPSIGSARIDGDLAAGTEFYWKSGPSNITSTLQEVEQPNLISWSGSTMGIRAHHTWSFRQEGDRTVAVTEESWDGLLPKLLRWPLKRVLKGSLGKQMKYLKTRAELEAGNYEPPVP